MMITHENILVANIKTHGEMRESNIVVCGNKMKHITF